MLSFFPRDVLDEILDLIESVSEGFPIYSSICPAQIKIKLSMLKLVGAIIGQRRAVCSRFLQFASVFTVYTQAKRVIKSSLKHDIKEEGKKSSWISDFTKCKRVGWLFWA